MRRRDASETWLPSGPRPDDASTPPPASPGITAEAEGRYAAGPPGSDRVEPAVIGEGGVGRVVAVFDLHLGREVAVKELVGTVGPAGSGADALVERFAREARVTAQLEHPSIVPVHELGRRADGSLYYVMRRVRGRTLQDALADAGGLEGRLRLLGHFVQLCQAMAYAHARGVVHRDLKPRNVMVGEFGETVVLDWGLARVHGDTDLHERDMARALHLLEADGRTLRGSAMGTPAYMSPEQASGEVDAIDARSDVWSLGAVLFVFLTGRPPFTGETAHDVLRRVREEDPPTARAVEPRAPPELAAIAEKALRRDPALRYPSAEELARDVEAWREGRLVGSYLYSWPERLWKRVLRHRAAVTTGAVAALVFAGTVAGAFVRVRAERDRAVAAESDAATKAAELRVGLARSLTDRAQAALREGDAGTAWLLAARSLAMVEDPESRGALLRARAGWVPRVAGVAASGVDCPKMAWRPDGRELACVGRTAVRILRGDGSPPVIERPLGDEATDGFAWSRDGARFATGGAGVRVWDRASGDLAATLVTAGTRTWSMAFLPDGRLVTGDDDTVVRVWDVDAGRVDLELRGHTEMARNVAVSPDGTRLATAGNDPTVRLWDLRTGRELPPLEHHGRGAFDVAWSPDGRTLATAGHVVGGDGRVRLWDVATGRELAAMEGHTGEITQVAFSPDGRRVGSRSADGTVRLWDVEERRPLARVSMDAVRMRSLAFTPDGARLTVAGSDDRLYDLDLGAPAVAGSTAELDAPIGDAAFTPSGDAFTTAAFDGTVRTWDAITARERRRLGPWPDARDRLALVGPDGAFLAGGARRLTLHDATGAVVRAFDGPSDWLDAVRVDHAGTTAWLGWRGDPVIRLDLRTGERRVLAGPTRTGRLSFALDEAGRRLATVDGDAAVEVLDADSGAVLATAPSAGGGYVGLAWAPDGATLAAGRSDGGIDLLRGEGLAVLATLRGHDELVDAVAFTPDGATLLSAGWDRTVRAWDVPTRSLLATLRGPRNRIWSLDVSPDGGRAVVGCADHRAWVFPLDDLRTPGDSALARARAWLGETAPAG